MAGMDSGKLIKVTFTAIAALGGIAVTAYVVYMFLIALL
jgi:hypothetical protein